MLVIGLLAAAVSAAMPAAAQERYPLRPVRLVIPSVPAGVHDVIGRVWAERVKPLFGPIVIDNRGGGAGSIGANDVAHSPPDGYSILLGSTTTHVLVPPVMANPPYDPVKDFSAVTVFAYSSTSIVVNPSLPARTLAELIAYTKANPGKLSYGSAGTGSLNHLTAEAFKLRVGLPDLIHVPYRGAGPAIADILAGQIPMIVPAMTNIVLDLHRAGKLRVLAVTHGTRLAAAPELPTAVEQGFTDLVAPNFVGVFAPAGTPKPIIDQVAQANLALLADHDYRQLLVSGTFEPHGDLNPEAYRRYVENELARWSPIVTTLGLKID